MSIDWNGIILDAPSPAAAWTEIFAALLALSGGMFLLAGLMASFF